MTTKSMKPITRKSWLLVGNVCQNPPMKQHKVDCDFIRATESKADIIMLNEIGLTRYKAAAGRIFHRSQWWKEFLDNTQDPIFVRKNRSLAVGLTRSVKLNDGVKRVTPDRDLNVAKLHFQDINVDVVFMGTHWVSGKNKRLKYRRKLRQKLWEQNYKKTMIEVAYWNSRGFWVVIAGDFNDKTIKPFNDRMRWFFSGIIKVGISPPSNKTGHANVRVEVEKTDTISDVFTDKPFRLVNLSITRTP